MKERLEIGPIGDPGRGTEDLPVSALDRAAAISKACDEAEAAWRAALINKNILVAGEFPPHILEQLLAEDIAVAQIHPAHDGGFAPAHFHHLAPYGLKGFISLHDLAEIQCDIVLVHGTVIGSAIRVSPLVPIVLRMFPQAERYLLPDDHVAPHMIARTPHDGFRNVGISL